MRKKRPKASDLLALLIAVLSGAAFCYAAYEAFDVRDLNVEVVVQENSRGEHQDILLSYFQNNKGKQIHKWLHYFEIYEKYFARFRNSDVTILEIGVAQGGSLQMWKNYFGPRATVVGIDIDPNCLEHVEEQIDVMIGDQADPNFLMSVMEKYPKIDIVIDDGGHTMNQQKTSFRHLYPHVNKNGIYICEDTHTSYWDDFSGGLGRKGTFIEMSKELVDGLHAWHFEDRDQKSFGDFTLSTFSLHFYPSAVVFEKRPMKTPEHFNSGKATISDH